MKAKKNTKVTVNATVWVAFSVNTKAASGAGPVSALLAASMDRREAVACAVESMKVRVGGGHWHATNSLETGRPCIVIWHEDYPDRKAMVHPVDLRQVDGLTVGV